MSEEGKKELLCEIREALGDVPDAYQKDVARAIVHDISVMGKAIQIASVKA